VIRSLSEVQKGAIFYLITLGLALLVALFGPTGAGAIQILNMLTVTTGVLLMLLVITPDGFTRLAEPSWACTTPASDTGRMHCSLRWLCSSPRTGPRPYSA
jgi:hypothetical protein